MDANLECVSVIEVLQKRTFVWHGGSILHLKKTMLPWSRPIFKPERWSKLEHHVYHRSCIWKLSVHVDMITHMKSNMDMKMRPALRWKQTRTRIWLKQKAVKQIRWWVWHRLVDFDSWCGIRNGFAMGKGVELPLRFDSTSQCKTSFDNCS